MKNSKRIFALTLAMLFACALIPGTSFAAEISKETFAPSQQFIDFLTPFYTEDMESYVIMDGERNITQRFLADTKAMFSLRNWQGIYNYAQANITNMSYTETSPSMRIFGSNAQDVGLTETKHCYHLVSGIDGSNGYSGYTREVVYTLRGTIYYNPNTMLISSTVGPVVTGIAISPGFNNYTAPVLVPEIARDKLSATFKSSFRVTFGHQYGMVPINIVWVDFGNVTESLTIKPE